MESNLGCFQKKNLVYLFSMHTLYVHTTLNAEWKCFFLLNYYKRKKKKKRNNILHQNLIIFISIIIMIKVDGVAPVGRLLVVGYCTPRIDFPLLSAWEAEWKNH